MNLLKYFLLICLSLLTLNLYSQNGFIRGSVFDGTNGEALIGAAIVVEGTTRGGLADLDGKFNLNLEPGVYNLKISFVSYETMTLNDIVVTAGKVTLLDDIRLAAAAHGLSEVVVSASMSRNTENALFTVKMKSPSLLDGISAAGFRKIGDSDAASTMKRVTGVTVEGGKYVYVRGLGDRYTKTIVNGVDIPGLDPDRNTMQMDIFPTSVIDNIIVYKSFSAELPADFTGGVIDIALKDFPEQKRASFSLTSAFNPDYHFRSDFLSYPGGKYDFLGFDDGTRSIPAITDIPFFAGVIGNPDTEAGKRYREILEGFNPTMAAVRQNSFVDYSLSTSVGNQIPLKKVTLGYNVGFSYKSNTEFYKDAEYGRYGLSANQDVNELEVREFQVGDFGVKSVLMSSMAGIAMKTRQSKYRLNLLHLQNGESKAGIFDYEGSEKGSNFHGIQHNLEYNQRSLTNVLLDGKHVLSGPRLDIIWKISPTISVIQDPDTRFLRYVTDNQTLRINTEGGFPERIWRNLSETNIAGVLHMTKEFDLNGNKSRLNFGGAYTWKHREFIIRKYAFNIRNVPLTGNPDEIFRPENLWPLYGTDTMYGTTYDAHFMPSNPNQFDASSSNVAGYISTELSLLKNLKTIVGVRMEKHSQRYTGQDQLGTNVLSNEKVLDDINLFPSVNIIYNLSASQNLRLSYAKTIARPSFKELSYAEIADPVSNRTFIGGMFRDSNEAIGVEYWDGNLVSTFIHNLDIRWEIFQGNGQMISLSGFSKRFIRPIEIVQYATQSGSFQPRNVGDGKVTGAEVELRQNLSLVSAALSNFSLSTNFAVTKSSIELSTTELQSRIENARTGQTIGKSRVMAGQAPYIINAGLTYDGGEDGFWKGFEAGLFYNVQGITLQYVGIADLPDIYTLPFHSLNFNANKSFGRDNRTQLGIKIDNLLNDTKESVFRSFNVTDPFFTKLEPGITFHIRLSYTLF